LATTDVDAASSRQARLGPFRVCRRTSWRPRGINTHSCSLYAPRPPHVAPTAGKDPLVLNQNPSLRRLFTCAHLAGNTVSYATFIAPKEFERNNRGLGFSRRDASSPARCAWVCTPEMHMRKWQVRCTSECSAGNARDPGICGPPGPHMCTCACTSCAVTTDPS
jgi:hypothetical protein